MTRSSVFVDAKHFSSLFLKLPRLLRSLSVFDLISTARPEPEELWNNSYRPLSLISSKPASSLSAAEVDLLPAAPGAPASPQWDTVSRRRSGCGRKSSILPASH